MCEPRSSFVDADNVRLHYLEWEPGDLRQTQGGDTEETLSRDDRDDVPVVLLHALGATADSWRLLAPHLEHHCVVAFDLRGHGLSERPDCAYDFATVAEDVIAAMASLGLGQVAIVGHGWGARVGMTMATRHPALVSHLVLVDCPLVEPRLWPGMTRARFIREREVSPEIYVSRRVYLEALQEEMIEFWSSEVEAIVLAQVRELSNGRLEERLSPKHEREIRESLWDDRALLYYGKISCPVLLIPAAAQPQPDEEPPENLESAADFAAAKGYIAQQVARAISRCSLLWMPDTVHNIQLQRPQMLAQAINGFLQDGS
jgi:pimeloyl-ACP methyl ester carboxylesterase